nr:hypothetical protein [Tanacetum cinerariifolium]
MEIQTLLAALMKQQEQSSKQQEKILKAVRDKPAQSGGGVFSSGSSFSSGDADSRGTRPLRIEKVEFPKFSGADVEGWIYRCEHFFAMDETSDVVKLRCAVVHLEGDALQWHQAYMKIRAATISEIPWNDYVKSISARFFDAMFEDPLEELASLNQTGTLYELNTTFDSLGPVKMFKPRTLHEVYGLAKTQALNNEKLEEKLNMGKWNGGNTKSYNNSKITPPTNATKLPLLPTPNHTNTTVTKPTRGPRRLSRKELENKRAKGECFWCTERFVPGHKCTRNQNQVYIIEMEDEDDLGADETETEDEEKEHHI